MYETLYLYYFSCRHAEDEDINAPPPQIQAAIKNNDIGNLLDLDWDQPAEVPTSPILTEQNQHGSFNDLLSIGGTGSVASQANNTASTSSNVNDIMNLFNSPASPTITQTTNANSMSAFTNDLLGGDLLSATTATKTTTATSSSTNQQTPAKDPFADLF